MCSLPSFDLGHRNRRDIPTAGELFANNSILALDLINVFLDVGSVQITCGNLPTQDCCSVKIVKISGSSFKEIAPIIRKLMKTICAILLWLLKKTSFCQNEPPTIDSYACISLQAKSLYCFLTSGGIKKY